MTSTNLAYDYGGIHPLVSSSSDTTNSTTDSMPPSPPLCSTKDDVTTIFVVGFPDDMQEREFQNMFMFSKGFEAASLKWHCKDQTEDQEFFNQLNNTNKKQMVCEIYHLFWQILTKYIYIYIYIYRSVLLGFVLAKKQVRLLKR
jgi:hypothetical protein